MVYRGKILNGQVVLEGAERLPEGTEVRVEPINEGNGTGKPRVGSPEAIMPFAGIWADQADDIEKSLAELRAMKEEEVRRQATEPEPEPDSLLARHQPRKPVLPRRSDAPANHSSAA